MFFMLLHPKLMISFVGPHFGGYRPGIVVTRAGILIRKVLAILIEISFLGNSPFLAPLIEFELHILNICV